MAGNTQSLNNNIIYLVDLCWTLSNNSISWSIELLTVHHLGANHRNVQIFLNEL